MAKQSHGSKLVVYAALAGNLLIAITKFIAAGLTGSSAMLTEGVHSVVDTGNQGLLLYGMHRAKGKPDAVHPFGYGRELYFWSFIVALLIFAGGAGVSIYEGVLHIREPEPIDQPLINYIVLGLAFLFEGTSWTIALREFSRAKGDQGWWQAIRASKDPPTFVTLFEDSAALLGIIIAAIAIFLAIQLEDPRLDGMGSICIGGVLGMVALLLARESKGLLIGERADAHLIDTVRRMTEETEGVTRVHDVLTVHLAPDQVTVAMNVDFDDHVTAGELERLIAALEGRLRSADSRIRQIFIKPQSEPSVEASAIM